VLLFHPPEAEPTPRDVALQGAVADLSEFSFSALHDLKEPLHLIKGYLALLRQRSGHDLPQESQEYLEYAHAGAQRMQALVLNLLEYLRADVKGIAPEPIDLGAAWDEAVTGLRLQIHEAEAAVSREALPTVLADRPQMARVLQNLLSNALKFRGERPPIIRMSAKRTGATGATGEWELIVKDNGIGIDAKDQARVLQPFQRVHSTDQYPGTGLGLSISKKIVQMHGGRFWLESNLGEGTEVHFTIPAGPVGAKGA
jgi:signal transduction histidine kinase